jgi:predicted DNA-binding protein (MmcQ/YjbR family)
MDIIQFRDYCLSKPHVTEEFPFDSATLVFKVLGKMFALCDVDNFVGTNLKCDPERALELREEYDEIKPGFHMNKKHWNTVQVTGNLSDSLLRELIDHSFDLVVLGLPTKLRNQVNNS